MDLHSPKAFLVPTRKPATEGYDSPPSKTNHSILLQDSPFPAAFVLRPRRNYEEEFETRTLYIPPIDNLTSKKLELPQMPCHDELSTTPEDEEEAAPTFSLKRKRQLIVKDGENVSEPSSSYHKLGKAPRILFRPNPAPRMISR